MASVVTWPLMAAQASKLEIRLLGDPEVLLDGAVQPLPASKKTRALLGYLVATGRPQRRERLCELLWEGPDDPRAGLRWSLAKLRPLLDVGGVTRILADRERVGFERHAADVDVSIVNALRGDGLTKATTERLTAAVAQFRGPFLEGLELSSCPAFHAWCVAEREGLRALHVELLTALIARQRDEPARALAPARALVALDPLAESPRLLLLDVLASLGDTRRALDEYEDYAATLRRELGVKPSAQLELRRMALTAAPDARAHGASAGERLAPHGGRAPAPRDARARLASAEPSPMQREMAPKVPLVGRAHERLELERLLSTAGSGGSVLLVLGEPGLGKTCLLEELARLAVERGGCALSGRAFEAELVRPYGAFIDAMRSAAGNHPANAAESALPAPFSSHLADRTRLYAAILADLASLARRRAPLVLLLDDLHWFDEASAELFHYLARALAGQPALLAAAARKGELADNPAAQRLVRALGRERLTRTLELGPLAEDELRRLVSSAGHAIANERVIAEAAGNPLFALEAARALETGADLAAPLSGLIADRLGRLHDADRALLSWAAALGRSFDASVLSRVTGVATPELLESLERLERFAILRSRDFGYDFAHDLVRQAAYRQMSSPRRRLVHAQIARALSDSAEPEGPLASDVAHHAGLAGDAALAARACIGAGHRCLRLFAFREACDLAHRGRRFAASLPDGERVALGVELVALELLANPEPRGEAILSELAAEARRLGLASIEARAHYLCSVIHYRAEDSSAAFESALSRVAATRHSSPAELGAELAGAARCCLSLERDTEAAAEFLARARSLLGTDCEDAELIFAEGLLAKLRGELDTAAERLGHALFLARRGHQHWDQCECLLELLWIDLDRDRRNDVLQHVAQLCDVAERLGENAYAPAARCVGALLSAGAPGGSGLSPFAAFDANLPALAAAGANRMLSIVLNRGAEAALRSGDLARARRYADDALAAGERAQRPCEVAAALVTLAEIAQRCGDHEVARHQLEALSAQAGSRDLSVRVARAVSAVRAALERAPMAPRAPFESAPQS